MARHPDRVYVYDSRSGKKSATPVPRAHLRLYPFLREIPSSGRIPAVKAPTNATAPHPSQAPPSAAVPPVITPDSGPAAHQED